MEKLRLPSMVSVSKWSNADVLEWLRKADLGDCLEEFKSRAINGTQLLDLNEEIVITFSKIKIHRRMQIVKCINECKGTASNAKKLVKTIKDKKKAIDQNDPDEDADVGWGSDFDDEDDDNEEGEDEDDDDDDVFQGEANCGQSSFATYDLQNPDEKIYEHVGDFMSNGNVHVTGFRKLNDDESSVKDRNGHSNANANGKVGPNQRLTDTIMNGARNSISTDTSKNGEIKVFDSGVESNSMSTSKGSSPKPSPSPRMMPKPPNTKIHINKNKPPIIPRKPQIFNIGSRVPNLQIKRPPSEPPPPPLPKSPPPSSPLIISSEMQSIFEDTSVIIGNNDDAFLSPNIAEDEYLSPIEAETLKNLDRKPSLSTLPSLSSTRDGDSLNCDSSSLLSLAPSSIASSGMSRHAEEEYEIILNALDTNANAINETIVEYSEDTYEIVNDIEENGSSVPLNKSQNIERPLLPKVKDQSNGSSNKIKLKPDVFPSLPNWSRIISKEKTMRDKQDNVSSNGDCSSPSFDVLNNNSHSILHQQSFPQCSSVSLSQHSARPLPPLPRPQNQSAQCNESLRAFSWFHIIEREEAESMLMSHGDDGTYLVRESKRAGKSNPYTLTIFHDGRVFHLNIRKRPDELYALGKEKPREKTFKTVADLVTYHHSEPILLTTRGTPAGKTRLIISPNQ